MPDEIKHMIEALYRENNIDLLDISLVKRYALERKMYELIVYINNNLSDYIIYVRNKAHK